jgi:hypothetical protein
MRKTGNILAICTALGMGILTLNVNGKNFNCLYTASISSHALIQDIGWSTKWKFDTVWDYLDGKNIVELNEMMKNNEQNVKVKKQVTSKKKKSKKKIIKYTTTYVNYRKKPNKNAAVFEVLKINSKVSVIATKKKWTYVNYGKKKGYIKTEYLSDQKVSLRDLNRWGLVLSADEKDLLAKILWCEARGESQIGREAVVEVIFNRIHSDLYGADLYSVLSAGGQFSSWNGRDSAVPGTNEYNAIDNVLKGNTYIMDYGYIYFSTGKSNGRDFFRIGNHWFGRK